MKKYFSVFMIYIRSSIYKFSALLCAMAAVQTVLFLRASEKLAFESTGRFAGIETIVQESNIFIVCGVSFVLLTLILCYGGCEFSGKQGYTLRRLLISEKKVFLMQSVANALFYSLFWLSEIVIVRAFMALYVSDVSPVIYTNQMLMLSFYRSDLLSGLMPMSNLVCLARNIIWVLAMAVTTAYFPYMQRRRKTAFSVIIMVAIVIVGFVSGGDSSEMVLPAVWAVMIIISALVRVMRGEYDEKEA